MERPSKKKLLPKEYDCTGIILAGGKNSRLPGIKKAFHKINGKMIIDIIIEKLSTLLNEIIIVTNDPCDFSEQDSLLATDILPCGCSLAGIHAGMFYAAKNNIFVAACDTPFLKIEIVEKIISHISPAHDIIIPETCDGIEPLCAVYSKKCLPAVQTNLNKNIFMIKKIFKKNRTLKIPVHEIKKIDPEMISFFNINTPCDLDKANRFCQGHGPV
ncbi:MAG: molybdenum cofactor guanylyltransferase [Thermodesulfobacteriota bacterium]|nr:molybdenum cofactor guanylyltransferase [Thermodesulfobacteriota bacterium]